MLFTRIGDVCSQVRRRVYEWDAFPVTEVDCGVVNRLWIKRGFMEVVGGTEYVLGDLGIRGFISSCMAMLLSSLA